MMYFGALPKRAKAKSSVSVPALVFGVLRNPFEKMRFLEKWSTIEKTQKAKRQL
jgi:hypothetical protein